MTENKVVPKLRFEEFEMEWVKVLLKNCTLKIGSGSTPKGGNKVYQKVGIPFIRSQNVIDNKLVLSDNIFISDEINFKMKGSIVKPNDILLNITGGSIGRSCVVPLEFVKGNVNQHVCIIRLDNEVRPYFIQPFLASQRGQKLIQQGQTGSGREGLNFQSIASFKLHLPSLPEQQKIASFLSAVDKKLQQLTKKKELLEEYKKGVMQKIFSQELRFKDDNGNNYPDWEEKRLNEVFHSKRGSGLSGKNIVSDGKNKCILYGALYTKYDEVIDEVIESTNEDGKVKSQIGDILVPASTTTTGIDLANFTALNQEEVLLGGDITILRFINKGSNIYWAYYLTHYKKYKVAAFAQGSTIVHIYFSHFGKIQIEEPSLKEQQKIANFLSSLDSKIKLVSTQIENTKVFKKGLLQQMFV